MCYNKLASYKNKEEDISMENKMQQFNGIEERWLMELREILKESYALNVKIYESLNEIRGLLSNKVNSSENLEVSLGKIKKDKTQQLRHVVALHLKKFGIPTQIKGYHFLKEGIALVIEDPKMLKGGITKVFYPKMAQVFDTTPSRIERAVRHAIQSGCDKISVNTIQEYFGEAIELGEKPTNSQFISALAEIIREELNY